MRNGFKKKKISILRQLIIFQAPTQLIRKLSEVQLEYIPETNRANWKDSPDLSQSRCVIKMHLRDECEWRIWEANISANPWKRACARAMLGFQVSANRMLSNQIEIESIEIGFPLIIGRSMVTSFSPGREHARLSSSRLYSDPRFTDTANRIGVKYDRIIELSSLSNRIRPQYYCRTKAA